MASVTQLRAFHMVAMAGGYSQAARESATSQSNLSNQVRQLEASSGRALFERRPQGVTLTADGEVLYEATTRLFSSVSEIDTILQQPKAEGGSLRAASDGIVHLLPILSALRRRRPSLVFSILLYSADGVIEQIAQYRADVGISARLPEDDRFYTLPLVSMNIGVFVPNEHPWARRSDIAMKDLQGCDFVLRAKGSRTRAVFEQNLKMHGVTLGGVMEVSTLEGVRETVAAGFGLGVVADREFWHDTRLHFLPLRDARLTVDEYVICLEEKRRLPLVADFLRCAAAR